MTAYARSSDTRRVRLTFPLLFGIVALTRLAVVPWRVSLLVRYGGPTDLPYFLELARMTDRGLYPYIHLWVEYPPVFPGVVTLAYRLSASLASGPAVAAWFYSLVTLFVVACELGTLAMLYKLALLLGTRESALRSALIYSVLFVPAYLWAGWFDHLPTFLFLSALYLLLRGRELPSAALVGLGIVSKLFPVMLLPLALCTMRGLRRQVAYTLVVGLVVAAFLVPLGIVNPATMVASIRTAFSRPSWETVWALLDGYYSYGKVAPLAMHLDPANAAWVSHGSKLPWTAVTVTFGLLFAAFYARFYGTQDRRQLVGGATFSLVLLLLYSKGYSPQYLTWIAPLLVLLYPNRQGIVYLALLGTLNLIELPGYFTFFPAQRAVLATAVVGRTTVLVAAAWDTLTVALTRPARRMPLPDTESARLPGW